MSPNSTKRKLHTGDIGTFRDEVRSTGASTGVIYSRTGFTKPALRKAQASGYPCCRIYQNEPADIPASICFEQFTCSPQIRLTLITDVRGGMLMTWHDVFMLRVDANTILDHICAVVCKSEEEAVQEIKNTRSFPPDWTNELEFLLDEPYGPIKIRVFGRWKKYRAQMEAMLLDGSYCLSNNSFSGTQYGPWMDTQGEHPGEAWTEITDPDFVLPSNRIVAVRYRGKVKDLLQEKLGPRLLYQQIDRA